MQDLDDKIETQLFRRSPLGTRISDSINNPLTTRDLLFQKKSQAHQLYQEKEELKLTITKTYTSDLESSPLRSINMPSVRIHINKSKLKKRKSQDSDSEFEETLTNLPINTIDYPDDSEIFFCKIENKG